MSNSGIEQVPSSFARLLLVGPVVFGVYLVAARLGLLLAFEHTNISLVWPSGGIALAACLIFGYRIFPAIAAGAFLANFMTHLSAGTAAVICIGNTAEAVVGAYLVKRYTEKSSNPIGTTSGVFYFLVLGCLAASTIAASVGTSAIYFGGYAPQNVSFSFLWINWWVGDSVGAIVVAPLLLSLLSYRTAWKLDAKGALEGSFVLALLIVVGLLVFGSQRPVNLALAYVTVPLVVVAAFRHQQAGASLSLIVLAAVAIWGTSSGTGPFSMANLNESLLALQAFIGIIAATALITAAVVAERQAAQQTIQMQLNDKEALLREVHHRVKNNLQVISSLLSIQASQADAKTAALLLESKNRVRSMALLHERLYASENVSHIDLSVYFSELIKDIEQTYAPLQGGKITVNCLCDPIFVSIDKAIPCGLLVNEMVTNAFKHAFPDSNGEIGLKLSRKDSKVALDVFDTGVGLPEIQPLDSSKSIGLRLISILTRQLDAELSIEREKGTAFHFEFEP